MTNFMVQRRDGTSRDGYNDIWAETLWIANWAGPEVGFARALLALELARESFTERGEVYRLVYIYEDA